MSELKSIVEALIFASPEPLTLKTLARLLDTEPREEIEAAIEALKRDYDRPGGLQIVEVAGGYQIVTRPELHEWVRRLFHERTTQKLSVAALETLAVVAYRQPVTKAAVERIRGVDSDYTIRSLLPRRLVVELGPHGAVAHPDRLRGVDRAVDVLRAALVDREVREAEGDVLDQDVEVEAALAVRQGRVHLTRLGVHEVGLDPVAVAPEQRVR